MIGAEDPLCDRNSRAGWFLYSSMGVTFLFMMTMTSSTRYCYCIANLEISFHMAWSGTNEIRNHVLSPSSFLEFRHCSSKNARSIVGVAGEPCIRRCIFLRNFLERLSFVRLWSVIDRQNSRGISPNLFCLPPKICLSHSHPHIFLAVLNEEFFKSKTKNDVTADP